MILFEQGMYVTFRYTFLTLIWCIYREKDTILPKIWRIQTGYFLTQSFLSKIRRTCCTWMQTYSTTTENNYYSNYSKRIYWTKTSIFVNRCLFVIIYWLVLLYTSQCDKIFTIWEHALTKHLATMFGKHFLNVWKIFSKYDKHISPMFVKCLRNICQMIVKHLR